MTDGSPAKAFTVVLARSGVSYVIPADETVVAVLHANDIDVPVSCQQGVCGTCITRVLDGIPEHHDMYFTEEEQAANDQFTPCCSRSRTDVLVIDL